MINISSYVSNRSHSNPYEKRRKLKMKYNPYDNVLKVVDSAAAILGYSEKDMQRLNIQSVSFRCPCL